MHRTEGIVVIVVAATLLVATAGWVRPRIAPARTDVLLALEGAALGLGGLLVQHGVGTAAWILTPLAIALVAVLHVRVLFAGSGPLRT